MPKTYTRIVSTFGLLLAFVLAVTITTFAQEQARPQPPGQQPSAQQPPSQLPPAQPAPREPSQKPAAQIARGELTDVDAQAKMLTIKPTEGAEQKFQYNDATKVTGDRAGVAGLATLSGKQVVVHFTSQGANRVATEIEVQAAADKPADRPGADRPGADRPGTDKAPGADRN
jgi:hypothetical protein